MDRLAGAGCEKRDEQLFIKRDADGKKVKMECRDVPVMAILKEFRTLAGPASSKAHRPAMCKSYHLY